MHDTDLCPVLLHSQYILLLRPVCHGHHTGWALTWWATGGRWWWSFGSYYLLLRRWLFSFDTHLSTCKKKTFLNTHILFRWWTWVMFGQSLGQLVRLRLLSRVIIGNKFLCVFFTFVLANAVMCIQLLLLPVFHPIHDTWFKTYDVSDGAVQLMAE